MPDSLESPMFARSKDYIISPNPQAGSFHEHLIAITQGFQSSIEIHWPIRAVAAEKPTVETGTQRVFLSYATMERGRPYPVKVGDFWIIAVLHHGASQATLYRVPDDD